MSWVRRSCKLETPEAIVRLTMMEDAQQPQKTEIAGLTDKDPELRS
jgi:hypothetical protein